MKKTPNSSPRSAWLFLLLGLLWFLPSCATYQYVPPPVPEPGKGLVIFYNQHNWLDNIVKLDGKTLGHFQPGYYWSHQMTPGTHVLKVGGGLVWADKEINVEAGQTYYVCSEEKGVFLGGRSLLLFIDPMEGAEIVSKLKREEGYNYMVKKPKYDSGELQPSGNTNAICHTAVEYASRGTAKFSRGDLVGAQADYSQAIELKPDFAEAYGNRGSVELVKSDFDSAIADCTKAIELKPDYADAYCNRGAARERKGDLDGAIEDDTKALKLKSNLVSAYVNRGVAKRDKSDWNGAIADFTKAIKLKPGLANAYHQRGLAKQAKGDLGGAKKDFKKALEIKPGFAAAQKALDDLNKKVE